MDTFINVGKIIVYVISSTVTALLVGVVLLILALIVLPNKWTIFIIKRKPALLKEIFKKNDKYFLSILSILLHSNFTEDYKNDEFVESKIDEIRKHKEDLDKIENNMFTIDLLSDLFQVLQFTVVRGYMISSDIVIEEIINYFSHYSMRLRDTSYRKNFAKDILKQFDDMSTNIKNMRNHEKEHGLSEASPQIARMYTSDFAEYLKNEKEILDNTRNLLLNDIKDKVINVLRQAK